MNINLRFPAFAGMTNRYEIRLCTRTSIMGQAYRDVVIDASIMPLTFRVKSSNA